MVLLVGTHSSGFPSAPHPQNRRAPQGECGGCREVHHNPLYTRGHVRGLQVHPGDHAQGSSGHKIVSQEPSPWEVCSWAGVPGVCDTVPGECHCVAAQLMSCARANVTAECVTGRDSIEVQLWKKHLGHIGSPPRTGKYTGIYPWTLQA